MWDLTTEENSPQFYTIKIKLWAQIVKPLKFYLWFVQLFYYHDFERLDTVWNQFT